MSEEYSSQEKASPSALDVFTKYRVNIKDIVNMRQFVDHFISRRIISERQKKSVTMDSLLSTINSELEGGIDASLREMLSIMKTFGTIGPRTLAEKIEQELLICKPDQRIAIPKFHDLSVEFNINDRVDDLFLQLVAALGDIMNGSNLTFLHSACVMDDATPASTNKLPSKFKEEVFATKDVYELLGVLTTCPYCNWMNIRMLEKIVASSRKTEAKNLIKKYKDIVFSKKVIDVLQEFPKLKITEEYHIKVKNKWEKDLKDITVKDVVDHWAKLQTIFGVDDVELLLDNLIKGSIVFHWLIPAELMSHARLSAFKNWYNLKDVSYLSIGDHMIKNDQLEFTKEHISSNTATPQQVIDHFTDFLLVSLNHELLLPLMQSHGLLADHDLELVNTGPTGYHKNQLILGYVKMMDDTNLRIFSNLLQESHPHVIIPLEDSLEAMKILSSRQSLTSDATKSSVGSDVSHNLSIQDVQSRKIELSPESSTIKHFKCSTVNVEFLKVVHKLNELLKHCNPKIIIERCRSLMASDICDIPLFPAEFIKSLQRYNHTASLLKVLSSFCTWSDHSILRTLLEFDDEAVKLLDEYESQLDPSQQLSSYPLPPPAPCMTPCDGSAHTLLAVKCAQKYHQCLLEHVFDVRSSIVNKCDISPHCLQLLAVKSDFTILCWLVPKSVVTLISCKVLEKRSAFYYEGILEVSMLPRTLITTGIVISMFVEDLLCQKEESKSLQDNDTNNQYIQNKQLLEHDDVLEQISQLQSTVKEKDKTIEQLKASISQLHEEKLITKTSLAEALNQSKHDLEMVAVKYQEVKSKPDNDYHQLLEAVRNGNIGTVKELVTDDKFVVETRGPLEVPWYGATLLGIAALNKRPEVFKELLKRGAKIDTLDKDDDSILSHAAYGGSTEIVGLLLSAGVDVNAVNKNKWSPLHWASVCGNVAVVKQLVDGKADVNLTNNCGYTPLQHAMASNKSSVVWYFVKECKIDISIYDKFEQQCINRLVEKEVARKVELSTAPLSDEIEQPLSHYEEPNEASAMSTEAIQMQRNPAYVTMTTSSKRGGGAGSGVYYYEDKK